MSFIVRILTSSYHGAFRHYTLEPIDELALHQHNIPRLRQLLVSFNSRKTQELEFVKKAVINHLSHYLSEQVETSISITSFYYRQPSPQPP
jgi:hypothetical protein